MSTYVRIYTLQYTLTYLNAMGPALVQICEMFRYAFFIGQECYVLRTKILLKVCLDNQGGWI